MKDASAKDEQENPEIPEEPETPPEEKLEEPIKPPVSDSNAGNWKWYLIGAAVLGGGVFGLYYIRFDSEKKKIILYKFIKYCGATCFLKRQVAPHFLL